VTVSNLAVSQGIHYPLSASEDEALLGALKCFWQLESLGIAEEPTSDDNPETFLTDVRFTGNRYTVNLPWKLDPQELPDHQQMCTNRLRTLLRRLQKDKRMLKDYDQVIQEQIKQGIVEKVPSIEGHGPVHYLPHLPVVRADRSTTKIRVVYDGSAKTSDSMLSLNDCLHKGPNLIPKLFEVLIGFRNHRVALTADVEKAFLMIGIEETDRDMLRFVWPSNPQDINSDLIHLRFTRLVFGLKPSPAILGAVILKHCERFKDSHPGVYKVIENDLYVDDLITGEDSVEKAFKLYKAAKGVMSFGGFNLRKWHTNSLELHDLINQSQKEPDSNLPYDITAMSEERPQTDKILGVLWDGSTDVFTFKNKLDVRGKLVCKRTVLRITASIFDPLGFLCPYVIKFKILFQCLCSSHQGWDEPLAGEMLDTWNLLINDLSLLSSIQVPRCYYRLKQTPVSVQLHGFSDASELAYAAVVYIRCDYGENDVETRLVTAKSRVAPLKRQTIPRLELLGTLILARLMEGLVSHVRGVIEVHCWTDSMTVLQWIRNKNIYRQYVQSRINEIRQRTSGYCWQHCPGNVNPADLPSRGMSAKQMVNSSMWWNGPEFLKLPAKK